MIHPLSWSLRDARLARLVVRSQRGEREAFRRLYGELYDPVSRFVRRRIRLSTDVDDLVSQVFFRLLESLPRIEPKRGSVFAYVIAVARHLIGDHLRHPRNSSAGEPTSSIPDSSMGPLERLVSNGEAEAVRAELAALPKDVRELLLLRFGDGFRYSEIAQMLELSEPAVRQRVSRAMRELRAAWAIRWQKREVVDER
jgi:RNA polymerase sigma-70 factor (ECF subfamily)